MKLSPETEEHFKAQNEYLYDEAFKEFSVFFTWLSHRATPGFWYAVHVKHSGIRGTGIITLSFSKGMRGEIFGKQQELEDFLRKASHIFMPEQEGSVWLATTSSESQDYSSTPDDLELKNIRMWEINTVNEVKPLTIDDVSETEEDKVFMDNYLQKAWSYEREERQEAYLKTFPELAKADSYAHKSLAWIVKQLSSGKHQIIVDIVSSNTTLNSEMSVEVDEDESSLKFGDNFEKFFSVLRQAYGKTDIAFIYILSQEDEKTISVKAWNIREHKLSPFQAPEVAILVKGLSESDPRYEFIYATMVEEFSGEAL